MSLDATQCDALTSPRACKFTKTVLQEVQPALPRQSSATTTLLLEKRETKTTTLQKTQSSQIPNFYPLQTIIKQTLPLLLRQSLDVYTKAMHTNSLSRHYSSSTAPVVLLPSSSTNTQPPSSRLITNK
ncbi:hypothetical protein M758_3G063800 [Ceratodon purpureus]|uniref:Uncharacterized protein n=1 Tax=Ceratodon purpureus TaxID=3225 RepID=A0A8T0IHZ1_CERPU|nr:hypothetical protein KC19_3G064500 [Ceratodon purpureus]KAG0621991.1 hypothetical protein M758_3G063800 [Ceratodon purpureus]